MWCSMKKSAAWPIQLIFMNQSRPGVWKMLVMSNAFHTVGSALTLVWLWVCHKMEGCSDYIYKVSVVFDIFKFLHAVDFDFNKNVLKTF